MALQEQQGIRRTTSVWRGPDHYDYHVNRKRMAGGRKSYRCTLWYLEKCRGRASAKSDETDFRQTTAHNHDPDRHTVQARALRHAILERCRNGDNTKFIDMYHDERRKLRISRQAASRITKFSLQSAMRRARLEKYPKIPRTIKALHKILSLRRYRELHKTLDGKDYMYAGRAGSAQAKTISAIFVTKRRLRRMKRVRKLYCDATFSPVPRGMKASQIWTLSTIRQHHVVPMVRVLMRSRNTAAYTAALTKIKELSPDFKPSTIMSDFEGAQQRALRRAFPNSRQHGCLFHYAKAVAGKARKLRMSRVIKQKKHVLTSVRMLCALPLLPQDKILEGYQSIGEYSIRKRISLDMLSLMKYWLRTWRPKLYLLSVSGCSDRTTNACEADNRNLHDVVKVKRPNVYVFLDGMLELEDRTEQLHSEWKRKKDANPNGLTRAQRPRQVSAVSNDIQIAALTSDLEDGHISVGGFLKSAAYTIVRAVNTGLYGKKKKKKRSA